MRALRRSLDGRASRVAPRRHYGRAAIAMALTLWAIVGAPVATVRRRVCAWPITTESLTRWPALQRWA
jgi:hypothetical protein